MKGYDTINFNFYYCLLHESEETEESISVAGMTSSCAYVFHKGRLNERKFTLASLFMQLPRSMRVSAGCKGIPWIMLRRCPLYEGCTLDSVEHVTIMGIAMGFIKQADNSDIPVAIQHVVVDDKEISKFVLQRKFNSR